jgi:molecular chaperone IbpA
MSYRLVRYSHNQLDDLFKLTPFSVGFDGMFDRLLTNTYNTSTTYPPYDVVKIDASNYEIRVALAGFTKDDIQVKYEDGTLSIESAESDDSKVVGKEEHLVHGISKRKFKRTFTLSDDMVVNDAGFKDGMLTVKLEKIIPDEKKPRTIDIK